MEYTQKIAEPHGRLIKYALNFRYILINLSEYNFEKLKIPLPARAILGISQKIWYLEEEEIFKDYIRAIADLFSVENNAALLQKIFVNDILEITALSLDDLRAAGLIE